MDAAGHPSFQAPQHRSTLKVFTVGAGLTEGEPKRPVDDADLILDVVGLCGEFSRRALVSDTFARR